MEHKSNKHEFNFQPATLFDLKSPQGMGLVKSMVPLVNNVVVAPKTE